MEKGYSKNKGEVAQLFKGTLTRKMGVQVRKPWSIN
jgi:hypothetical protein